MANMQLWMSCFFTLKNPRKGGIVMKKVFVVFSVLLLMGFAFDIQANDFFEWAVGDTIGPKGESAQFCAVDHEGKLWITDYGTPGHVGLYVFNSDGSQAPFSPITAGLDENGNTFNIANAGGVAYYDSVTYAISDNPGAVLRFKASDGTPLNGWAVSYRTGDIDVDTAGHVFVGHKVEAMFSVYDVAGTELTGSPFGVAGWHLNRGLSVTQDGSKIFLADESSDVIAMYTGSISGDVADYTKGSDFMTGLNNPSACEIDPNGRMWISNTGNNELIITELDGTILQTIPDVATPRGAAFDFDNNLAYVAHFTSATNMAHQLIPIHHPEPEELYTWWEKNAGGYTFFQKDDKTRGMDLNPVTGHLLVASRTGGNFIHIIDAGEYIGTLDMTGVSGGTFVINLVSVADDGVIYGSNLTTSGSGFKVYRWENESVAPTVAFDGNVDQRVGDSFTAIGSGTGTILYASGANGTKIYVFTTTDGISFSLFDEIPISSSLARGGVAPVADTLGSDIWVNCSGKQVALIDTSGTVLVTIGDTLNTFFAHIDYLETSGDRKLIAVAGGNVGDIPRCIRAEIWDVTNPFAPWYYEYGALTNTPNANVNGTGIAILEEKEDGVLNLYHLLGNNGIALYCEEELVVNTPPTAFHLISPEDNATIRFEDLTADTLLEVKWSQSFDIDPLDSVAIYEMIVLDESQATVFDTIYTDTLNYSPVPSENGTYKWFVLAKDTRGGVTSSDTFTVTFDIQVSIDEVVGIPETFALYQNYPNPFNPTTFIKYDLPKEAKVKIIIYNLMGEEVRALVNEKQNAGYKSKLWDGRDNNGNMVSSGVYIYRMITDEFQKTNKMIFLK